MSNNNPPKIALALGSGSARGLAHIGVLQVLEQENIPIHAISGCSMGAVIGAIYASGTDLHLLEKLITEIKAKDFFDYGVPRTGLVRGKRFTELIKMLTKDRDFGELDIPYNCVACDIRAGINKIFDMGKVYKAVRASMSIPGIFTPVTIDDILYVDGGVLDPVPVDAARVFEPDYVVAVDVGLQNEAEDINENTWEILMRTMDLLGFRAKKYETSTADVLVNPNVRHTAKYSTDDALETIEIGRQATRDVMPQIKALLEGPRAIEQSVRAIDRKIESLPLQIHEL